MITITIPPSEYYDQKQDRFFKLEKEVKLTLQHSLVSISKWESKWHRPFLSDKQMTLEETKDYIRCMTITQNVNPNVYNFLTLGNIEEVNKFIADPMTASSVNEPKVAGGKNGEQITSELIYYWMVALQIPWEAQKWHLNRLLMLIRICNAKNQPPKKMSKSDIARRNHSLNAARRKRSGSKG